MKMSIIIPTFREGANIASLVQRITEVFPSRDVEILFVDDSDDDTPNIIRDVASAAAIDVHMIHRQTPTGGLGGAVLAGLTAAHSDICVVMDGDLQHPPETIPRLLERYADRGDVDVVVASRYIDGGAAHGLANRVRVLVSRASTSIAKAMFPIKLRDTSDPMTGFFLIDRRSVDLTSLRPRGFKILLEILARKPLRVVDVPFEFGDRAGGESKATFRQGIQFIVQLASLRFGKMSLFAAVGAVGAAANIALVAMLTACGVGYIVAAIVAAELTIIGNFLLIERFVFDDLRSEASGVGSRFVKSLAFNNVEAAIRIPIMAMLVTTAHISAAIATALTLVVAFFVRFLFHALVVYAPRRSPRRSKVLVRDDGSMATAD